MSDIPSYLSSSVSTNGWGDLYIAGTKDDYDLGDYYSRYTDGNPKPMSIINVQGVFSRLPNYDGASLNLISLGGYWTDVNTQEFKDAIEDFKAHVFFLWGDIDHGGCFLFKNAEGTVLYFGMMYGWLEVQRQLGPDEYEEDIWYRYAMSIGQNPNGFTYEMCKNIGIGMTSIGGTGNDMRFPSFTVYAAGGLAGECRYAELHLESNPGQVLPTGVYTYKTTQSLIEATCVTAYEATNNLGVIPCRPWFCMRKQPLSYWVQNAQIVDLQGRWNGGKEIETDIDPYDNGDPSAPAGTPGSYPTDSDTIRPQDPNASGINALNCGFITLYNPTKEQIIDFNDYIFSDNISDAISNQLKRLIADPIDYLVFIAMCHFTPQTTALNEEITFAGIGSGVVSKVIGPEQFQTIDCGWIDLPEPTCSFMDYGPYAKAHIFLPYIGFREVNIEEIMAGKIGVEYQVDLLNGSCIAMVKAERPTRPQFPRDATPGYVNIIATYEGNVYNMIPLSSTDFRNLITGALGVIGGGMSLLTGNLGGLGAMASSVIGMKSNVNRSGNTSGSYGYMGYQNPYLIITRPFQSIPSNFGGFEGYPSNMYMSVGECQGTAGNNWMDGYLETDENTVWGTDITYSYNNTTISATDDEIAEIQDLFNKGVIVNV